MSWEKEETFPVDVANFVCVAFPHICSIPFARKFELSDWEFSQTFLFFWDKIERANYFIESFIKTRDQPVDGRLVQWLLDDPFSDGGQWDMLVNLVTKYGLVPKAYYPESHGSLASKGFNRIITRKVPCEMAVRILSQAAFIML